MRSTRVLPLLALFPLLGCDGAGDWLRGTTAATAYAAPLATDTSVVTTRRLWSTTGTSLGLSTIMPDGAGLATTDWKTGEPAVLDLASREFRRFRADGEPRDEGVALQTVASPDGSQIMFMWYPAQSEEGHLRVVDVATGESRMIMAEDSVTGESLWPLAWSPAGDSVFATMSQRDVGGGVKVVVIPVAGGTPRLVHAFPGDAPWWVYGLSPDGRWLLYSHELLRDEQSRSDIYIVDVRGGGARALVEHPADDLLVGWLPGTDVVLFSSDRSGTTDLWSVRVERGRTSGEPRLVRSDFFRSTIVGFGDDALFYRVETGSQGPAVINVDPQTGALRGAASPPLTHFGNVYYPTLAWSPDGQTLAAPSWGPGPRTVTVHSMATGDSRVFQLDEGVHPAAMEWAADGTALILRAREAWQTRTSRQHFLRLDLVTGTTTRLFAAADEADPPPLLRFRVTPDDRSIVLRQQRALVDGGTEMKLVLRSLDDGSERELYRTSGFIPEFSISADGTQLAFVQQVRESSDSLFVMRMDAAEPLRAVAGWENDEVTLLGWLAAGNALLAARLTEDGKAEEILRVELDGSVTVVGISPFKPVRGQRVAGYYRSRLVLSPAGNRLVHVVNDIGEELWRMDGLHELFASDADDHR